MSLYHGECNLDQRIEELLAQCGVNRGGIMVDVGAYHPTALSNSYYFETVKAFTVICVEANPRMAALLRTMRKNVFEFAAASESGRVVDFQDVRGPWDSYGYAGSGRHTFEGARGQTTALNAENITTISVTTQTLDDILRAANITKVDALSVDVEGDEFGVLQGFDFSMHEPKVCCIENYFEEPWLSTYMLARGYETAGRLHVDDFFVRKPGNI